MSFSPCVLIPTHNHFRALPEIVDRVVAAGLPVFVVDDGSAAETAAVVAALADPQRRVFVHRRESNGGKGAAVLDGFRLAWEAGFTHAVQVDADGQHDLDALPRMLAEAEAHPEALVSGHPQYDDSIPKSRKIGRWVTHLWVFVETLSLRITDSMCGFRVYPLAACRAMLAEERPGDRMEFDTEIMVRLFWRGVAPIMVPVRVTYPPHNTSNFDVWRDNLRISAMHTRLVLTLLARLPRILAHRPARPDGAASHWASLAERGAGWGVRLVAAAYRLLGLRACKALLVPVVGYFYLTGKAQRRASLDFLRTVLGREATWRDGFRHFMDFALRGVETLAAWSGAIPASDVHVDDPQALQAALDDPRGALLVVSHHGNVEILRALMDRRLRDRLTVLVHTRHAENYNRVLREFRPEAGARMIQVTEIGPATAIALRDCIERGEWVAIAADRVPVLSRQRVVSVPFLGRPAAFSQGPWLLASLLECPVYLMFCRREKGNGWRFGLESFSERVVLPRGERLAAMTGLAADYAKALEVQVRRDPWQWYNFFDFWGDGR